MRVQSLNKNQSGEGESGFLLIIITIAIVISLGYFTLGWIQKIKENRANYGKKGEAVNELPPPKSREEMGGYEVTY